jgi:hypothetical protein
MVLQAQLQTRDMADLVDWREQKTHTWRKAEILVVHETLFSGAQNKSEPFVGSRTNPSRVVSVS